MAFHHHRSLPMPERFWAKVERRSAADCWPWLAAKASREGYGSFRISRQRKALAHRMALALSGVAVPDDVLVLHRCDNPPCCNPAHLFIGTHADNMADKVQKGRSPGPWKLTPAQIDAIRAVRPTRATPIRFGVRAQMARAHGVSWQHIDWLMRTGWSR